jgi:hypothetical protein
LIKKAGFFQQLPQALPIFWEPEYERASLKVVRGKLKAWLHKVHQIANKEFENDIILSSETPLDVSNLDREEILKIFVDIKTPTFLRNKRADDGKFLKLSTCLFAVNGTDIPDRQRYRAGVMGEDSDEESSEDSDEESTGSDDQD